MASVTPEVVPGWKVAEEMKQVGTGDTAKNVTDKVVYTATAGHGLDASHMLNIALQMKLGCAVTTPTSTMWQGKQTLWFAVKQFQSSPGSLEILPEETLEWTGVPQGNDASWNSAVPKPAPYIFISHWKSCTSFTIDGRAVASPDPEKDEMQQLHKDVKPLVEAEAQARAEEVRKLREEVAALRGEKYSEKYESYASAGLALAVFSTVGVLVLAAVILTKVARPASS